MVSPEVYLRDRVVTKTTATTLLICSVILCVPGAVTISAQAQIAGDGALHSDIVEKATHVRSGSPVAIQTAYEVTPPSKAENSGALRNQFDKIVAGLLATDSTFVLTKKERDSLFRDFLKWTKRGR